MKVGETFFISQLSDLLIQSKYRSRSLCRREISPPCFHRRKGGRQGDRQDQAGRGVTIPSLPGGALHEARPASERCPPLRGYRYSD